MSAPINFKSNFGLRRAAATAVFSALMFFSSVLPVGAQDADPAKNPSCWLKEDCAEARKKFGFGDQDAADGFLKDLAPCVGGGYGKCLPAGQTRASIAFGGKKEFTDVGDYIQTVYKYTLSVVGILAAVLIVISGIQWTSSAGNPEAISSAKKRIVGALVGLVIAYSSYIILNTINPALVNLRLPQAFLLRNVPLDTAAGSFCRTKGPLYSECTAHGKQGEYACYPFMVDRSIEKFGEWILVSAEGASFVLMIPVTGPAAVGELAVSAVGGTAAKELLGWTAFKVGGKAVGVVGETAGKLAGKYLARYFGTPVKETYIAFARLVPGLSAKAEQVTLTMIKEEIKKDATKGLLKKLGDLVATANIAGRRIATGIALPTVGAGTVAVGAVALGGSPSGSQVAAETYQQNQAGTVSYFLDRGLYDVLAGDDTETNGLPGICEPSHAVANGQACNANVPNDCADGSVCIDIGVLTNWVGGAKFGICSSGEPRSVCNPDDTSVTCKPPGQCIDYLCSDGSFGTVCTGNPSICQNGLVCRAGEDGHRSYCFSNSKGGLNDTCWLTTEEMGRASAGEHGTCEDYLVCSNPPQSNIGVCTDRISASDGEPASPCYRNEHCYSGYCFNAQSQIEPYRPGTCN